MSKCNCEKCNCVQEVRDGVRPEVLTEIKYKRHFGIRGYRWKTITFGIMFNVNNNFSRGFWYPNIVFDFYKVGFVLGWDLYEDSEGTTLT